LGVFVFIMVVMYLARAPLLAGAAHAWVCGDSPVKADAIISLAGGSGSRLA
jgi:hypothetical protein